MGVVVALPERRVGKIGGRSEEEWAALSLEELQAMWRRRPSVRSRDREAFELWTKVRSEIYGRLDTRPADGQTHGSGRWRDG